MKKITILLLMFVSLTAFTIAIDKNSSNDEAVHKAVDKSLSLLQYSSHAFLNNAQVCHSCHSNAQSAITFALAKEKGFVIDDNILKENLDSILRHAIDNNVIQIKRDAVENNDNNAGCCGAAVIDNGYDFWALSVNHYQLTKTMQLQLRNLMSRQTSQGFWLSPNPRPPLEYYSFSGAALVMKAMQEYPLGVLQKEINERTKFAQSWMMHTIAQANEEKIYQLLGLIWTNGDRQFIQQQAAKLIAAQHADGGWSQLDSLPSDAYATGQSLYALYNAGLKTGDPVYQKGINFLLNTQFDDGSWNVQTRTYPVVPYVSSGFPHDDNQFISASGTNWATMALLVAVK
jgi:N-acyl-D-amino-acid deacylase